jgi:hypothetical protein
MPTTRDDIRGWLKEAKRKKSAYMLVVCDTFSYEDYPVYISSKETFKDKYDYYNRNNNMQRIMECYDMSKSIEKQLSQKITMNLGPLI